MNGKTGRVLGLCLIAAGAILIIGRRLNGWTWAEEASLDVGAGVLILCGFLMLALYRRRKV